MFKIPFLLLVPLTLNLGGTLPLFSSYNDDNTSIKVLNRDKRATTMQPNDNVHTNLNLGIIANNSVTAIKNRFLTYIRQARNINLNPENITISQITENAAVIQVSLTNSLASSSQDASSQIKQSTFFVNFNLATQQIRVSALIEQFANTFTHQSNQHPYDLNIIQNQSSTRLPLDVFHHFINYISNHLNIDLRHELINNIIYARHNNNPHNNTYNVTIDHENDPTTAIIDIFLNNKKHYRFHVRFLTILHILNNLPHYLHNTNLDFIQRADKETILTALSRLNPDSNHIINTLRAIPMQIIFGATSATIIFNYNYLIGLNQLANIEPLTVNYQLRNLNELNLRTNLGQLANNEPATIIAAIQTLNPNLAMDNLIISHISDNAAVLSVRQRQNAIYDGSRLFTFTLLPVTTTESTTKTTENNSGASEISSKKRGYESEKDKSQPSKKRNIIKKVWQWFQTGNNNAVVEWYLYYHDSDDSQTKLGLSKSQQALQLTNNLDIIKDKLFFANYEKKITDLYLEHEAYILNKKNNTNTDIFFLMPPRNNDKIIGTGLCITGFPTVAAGIYSYGAVTTTASEAIPLLETTVASTVASETGIIGTELGISAVSAPATFGLSLIVGGSIILGTGIYFLMIK